MKINPISWFSDYPAEKYLIFDTMKKIIKDTYALFGFIPFETPAVERIETLKAKGWDDNEIYGIHRLNGEKNDADLALRFDLTVPLARYIAQYEGDIKFPFKRQHIDRSWRGERAQTWRAREFYQADIDIIGREKLPLFADVEVIQAIYQTLKNLNFWGFKIHINNKKILIWFLESIGVEWEKQKDIIAIIDKKDKLKIAGKDIKPFLSEIIKELSIVEEIIKYIQVSEMSKGEIMKFLSKYKNEVLEEGKKELNFVYDILLNAWVSENDICFDNTISRGLNYYTGTIFETFLREAQQYGSIASGGRYENLVGNFSKNTYPWVGGSIGLTRLFQVLDSLKKFDNEKKSFLDTLVLNMWDNYIRKYLEIADILRKEGFSTEIFLDSNIKMQKQLEYANAKNIHYALIIGEDEIQNNEISIKNLFTWDQERVKFEELKKYFS